MRILIDLGEEKLRALDEVSKSAKRSRVALIREAVDDYLAKRYATIKGDAFGLWGNRTVDGVAYQRKLRCEW